MLTARQEKLIRSLKTRKGRRSAGFCLVEGQKNVKEAASWVEFMFTAADSKHFSKLVGTITPQPIAAVAKIPDWKFEDLITLDTIVVLDGVQDPGNVGTILRLCLGFNAGLVLVESADPSNPKVLRSSAGAFFKVPWCEIKRQEAEMFLHDLKRPIYRLEKKAGARVLKKSLRLPQRLILVAGSEGQGITLKVEGTSLEIPHNSKLESLNVAISVAITLWQTRS